MIRRAEVSQSKKPGVAIVVGSQGLTGAARFVLGSVASSVAHHAPCDVCIVHTTD